MKYLVDTNFDLAKKLSSQFSIGEPVSDIQSVLGKVDAAIVALPHKLHHPITVELLSQGLHVLVEKPMALTIAGANEMIKIASRNKKILAIGHFWRYQPEFKLVKRVIDEEWLEKLYLSRGKKASFLVVLLHLQQCL